MDPGTTLHWCEPDSWRQKVQPRNDLSQQKLAQVLFVENQILLSTR